MISHGILPVFQPNCTKFVFFWSPLKKERSDLKSLHFPTSSRKRRKFDGHGQSRNGHGKVIDKCLVKSGGI